MDKRDRSREAYREALKYMPGGVNSPVRAFGKVGGRPVFLCRGKATYVWDIDGRRYLDFLASWGPLLFGHAHPVVVRALIQGTKKGTSFGTPTEAETSLAKRICRWVPGIDKLRLVNSGTEATMSAVRLARAHTGRDRIVKFEGCYHGHGDSFLIKAGSGALTLGKPDSAGIPSEISRTTLIAKYNDLVSVERLFKRYPDQIAAVIVEPVAANMGLIPPQPSFLKELKKLTQSKGALLIFDEVVTGFRLARGGAQERYGVVPDITTLGKIIGGGLPVGVYGGSKEIMEKVSPSGPVYQAGTLSGNPLAVAAGNAILDLIEGEKDLYRRLEREGAYLKRGLKFHFDSQGIPAVVHQVGSMLCVFFGKSKEITNHEQVMQIDVTFFRRYHEAHLKRGIYLPPSPYETFFISAVHNRSHLDRYLDLHRQILSDLKKS